MIQKLQNFFHTDKKLGRSIFFLSSHIFFWFVYFALLVIIPNGTLISDLFDEKFMVVYIVIVVFIVSILCFKFFKKMVPLKRNLFYILNTLFVLITTSFVFFLIIRSAIKSFNYGGF